VTLSETIYWASEYSDAFNSHPAGIPRNATAASRRLPFAVEFDQQIRGTATEFPTAGIRGRGESHIDKGVARPAGGFKKKD
jgi:hypothetical protein